MLTVASGTSLEINTTRRAIVTRKKAIAARTSARIDVSASPAGHGK